MLNFAAICPHSPVLIPAIGKENLDNLEKTVTALNKLNKILKEDPPNTIVIVSPHGRVFDDSFSLLSASKYEANFSDFGDISTQLEFEVDNQLINKIKSELTEETSIKVVNNSELDYGSAVPLFYLTKDIKVKIVSLNYSHLDYSDHLAFGKRLKEVLISSDKKIALIASGDLSHCLTQDAPGGYCPSAKGFDQGLIETLKNKKIDQLLELDPKLIQEVGECGLKSILILLGVIKKMNVEPEFLSYESPFGVGYLVMNFKLNT